MFLVCASPSDMSHKVKACQKPLKPGARTTIGFEFGRMFSAKRISEFVGSSKFPDFADLNLNRTAEIFVLRHTLGSLPLYNMVLGLPAQ